MLFFLWGVYRGRRINPLDSAEKICIPSLNAVPVEEDSSIAVVTLSEMHCSPKRMDEVSIACDKACSEFLPSIDQGQIAVSRNFDINDPTHVDSQGNLEKQDSRIDSNSTSRVPTSSTLLFQEMKTTGSSLVMILALNALFDRLKILIFTSYKSAHMHLWCRHYDLIPRTI